MRCSRVVFAARCCVQPCRILAPFTPAVCAQQATPPPAGMSRVLFVQVGMGTDQHGQDVTKAAVRAVKHAIEHNRFRALRMRAPLQRTR